MRRGKATIVVGVIALMASMTGCGRRDVPGDAGVPSRTEPSPGSTPAVEVVASGTFTTASGDAIPWRSVFERSSSTGTDCIQFAAVLPDRYELDRRPASSRSCVGVDDPEGVEPAGMRFWRCPV